MPTALMATSTFVSWLIAYIVAHIDVVVLRIRFPDIKRPFNTPFYPIPQAVGIVSMGYVAMNVSPSPEMTHKVYAYAGSVLVLVSLIALAWVKFVMRRGPFEPEMMSDALLTPGGSIGTNCINGTTSSVH